MKKDVPSGFLPYLLWQQEPSFFHILQVFSKKSRASVFRKKELLIL